MYFLGEIGELSRRVPALLDDAVDRGSLLRAAFLRLGFFSHVAWLAADAPDRACEEIEAGTARWQQQMFDYLNLWVRGARTDIALYRGERPAPARRVIAPWRSFARSLERFVQAGFLLGLDSRARRRLGAAAQTDDARERVRLLAGVDRHARRMLRQHTRWGDPLAQLLRASVAAMRGDRPRALWLLEVAESGFATAEMALHGAVARRRRGELTGGEAGRALVASADAWMQGQGIRRPERMAAMLAPGRWR
jgi:hypothetical protein